MLAWLVHAQGIEPHIPVFDKSARTDGKFSRCDFAYGHESDVYVCPNVGSFTNIAAASASAVTASIPKASCATAPASSIATLAR
jgi:hypothetical protein